MPKRITYYLPFSAAAIIILVGIFFGEYYRFYDRIPHFDKALHVLGGLTAAWILDYFFFEEIKHMSAMRIVLVLVAGACLVGVLWEFAEYASNFTSHTYPLWYHYFHGGDLADTIGDLVADISGATLLTVPLVAQKKKR